jgi:hypothetical protein
MAATIACFAVIIFAPLISTKEHPHPAIVFLLMIVLLSAVWLIWSSVSWFLSLASIFVVRNCESAFSALSSATTFCVTRGGPVATIGTWFGLTHVVLFFVATSVIAFPLSLTPLLPFGVVVLVIAVFTLAYCAIVDTLYVARLAGYVAILEAPILPEPPPVLIARPEEPPANLIESEQTAVNAGSANAMVDQDELILGDAASVDSEASSPDEPPPTSHEPRSS